MKRSFWSLHLRNASFGEQHRIVNSCRKENLNIYVKYEMGQTHLSLRFINISLHLCHSNTNDLKENFYFKKVSFHMLKFYGKNWSNISGQLLIAEFLYDMKYLFYFCGQVF